MLIRSTVLLVCLSVIDLTVSRHISRINERATTKTHASQEDASEPKKQQPKTHLRFHTKPPKVLHVREGDNEFLECQVGGSLSPTIHWLKDGKIISQSESSEEDLQKVSSADAKSPFDFSLRMSRLYLDCLSLEDEAEYTCVAENPYQRFSTSSKIIVASSDDEVSCSNSHGQSPRIYSWTKSAIKSQGDSITLACRADGYPRPTIRWLGANEEELAIADFTKYEILPNGDLIVRDLSWTDMGTYSCIAENIHGEAKSEAFVYPVMPGP